MKAILLRVFFRAILFITSQHRVVGVRDWIASIFCVATLAISVIIFGALWVVGRAAQSGAGVDYKMVVIFVVVSLLVAFVPIVFVLKLRRNGITDADYSVALGIDYKSSLSGAHDGFDFMGISGSKLRTHEVELKEAIRLAGRKEKKVRMLLVDPRAELVIGRMEKLDGAVGYAESISGTMIYLRKLAENDPECFELRQYTPDSIDQIKPLRLFFSGSDCLVSPFSPSNGQTDQGRGLPQLRITERGFPRKGDVTLYRSLRRYFESNWAEEKGRG